MGNCSWSLINTFIFSICRKNYHYTVRHVIDWPVAIANWPTIAITNTNLPMRLRPRRAKHYTAYWTRSATKRCCCPVLWKWLTIDRHWLAKRKPNCQRRLPIWWWNWRMLLISGANSSFTGWIKWVRISLITFSWFKRTIFSHFKFLITKKSHSLKPPIDILSTVKIR